MSANQSTDWNNEDLAILKDKFLAALPSGLIVCVQNPRDGSTAWPIFDDLSELRAMMERLKVAGYKVQRISDPRTFATVCHKQGVRIMLNPRLTRDGRMYWTEARLPTVQIEIPLDPPAGGGDPR
jgi:hypothetical protein